MRYISMTTLAFAASFLVLPVQAKDTTTTAKIISFECGDNCYLTIKTTAGEEINALCSVDLCADWFESQSMPPKYKGRKVKVIIGTGKQVDAEGNVMGEYPEILKLSFAKK